MIFLLQSSKIIHIKDLSQLLNKDFLYLRRMVYKLEHINHILQ